MRIEINKTLHSKGKKPILYDLYYTSTGAKKPVILFCHGYKGFKDWGAWNLVAESFANAGFFFIKFNFSHNGGTTQDPIDFPDLEAFAKNNYSLELEDLDRILNLISTEKAFSPEIDLEKINLIGHSRGGGIVLIKAEEDSRIKTVTTWAGTSDIKVRFQEGTEAFQLWEKTGITHIENGRTKQLMPHYFQFYTDFIENEERLTIERAVQNLNIAQLIIQGAEDPTVAQEEAQAIHHWNIESKLEIIEKADHVFGAKHPWEGDQLSEDLKKTVALTIEFLKQNK